MALMWNFWTRSFQVFILLSAASAAFNPSQYSIMEEEYRLLRDLLSIYEKSLRPTENVTKAITVSMKITVVNIIELNEKLDLLEMIVWDEKIWKDVRLQWNPAEYSGLTALHIDARRLWIPNIVPHKNVDTSRVLSESLAHVSSDGTVVWVPAVQLKIYCQADVTKFPYDEQVCSVRFVSWPYDSSQINLTYNGSPENALILEPNLSQDWKVVNKTAVINHDKYPCCQQTWASMTVTLELERSPSFYFHIFILPATFLGLLVPVQHLLPPLSKERLTLGSVLLISLLSMNSMLLNTLPKAKSTIPTIQIYYLLTLTWNTLSIITSAIVFNAQYRGVRRSRLPDIIRTIFLGSLKKLVCMDDAQPCDVKGTYSPAEQPFAGEGGHQDDLSSRENTMTTSKTDHMALHVQMKSKAEDVDNILGEWYQVALVLDRILFVIFLAMFILCSAILVR